MATSHYRSIDFIQDVASIYSTDNPETIWACASPIKRLVTEGVIPLWINEQLKALSAGGTNGNWGAKEIVLHRGNGWIISAALFDTPRRFVHALPFFGFYAPLGEEALSGDCYRLPDGYRNDVFDPSLRVELASSIRLQPGGILPLETDRFAYHFHISRPQAVLRVETRPVRPLEWLFSKNTLQAWQANDADLTYTQLRVAAYVLGKIAHQSSISPLRRLAGHSHHAVRWAAIQNLGRLNRSEALIKIREALQDPHPHVRRAAQKTLDRLEGKPVK